MGLSLYRYIERYPYTTNATLQGYAGVAQFATWINKIRGKQQRPNQQDNDLELSDDIDLDSTEDIGDGGDGGGGDDDWLEESDERRLDPRISRHRHAAEKHFERALKLGSKSDMFLTYLVRLRCGKVEFSGLGSKTISKARKSAIHEMKTYLKRFYNKNNDSLLALR